MSARHLEVGRVMGILWQPVQRWGKAHRGGKYYRKVLYVGGDRARSGTDAAAVSIEFKYLMLQSITFGWNSLISSKGAQVRRNRR